MVLISEKYEVMKELGQGGAGQVFLVRHTDLNVLYALKLLNRSISDDDRFIEQFKKEASLLLRFSHPGITQLRDFGRTNDGQYYMAMDYCDGIPLKLALHNKKYFLVEEALEICIQLLNVLSSAHQQGIVHRDIKPENIMLVDDSSGERHVKVLDFGTAVLKQQFDEEEVTTIFGTPCYMSPEQAAGESRLDHRVDIYSLGILLFELLTGDVPFEGETVVQTLLMHLTHPIPSLARNYHLDGKLDRLVKKALAKDRALRYQSADEFLKACLDTLKTVKSTARKDEKEEEETTSPTEVQTRPTQEVKPKTKILCLDDDELILNILQHILEQEGFEVFTANDSSLIHNYLFSETIDLLVSDVEMPGLSGPRVCRLLKKSMNDLKVILFSNIPERDLEKFAEENMADGWISKQRKPNEWVEEIKEVLMKSAAKSE